MERFPMDKVATDQIIDWFCRLNKWCDEENRSRYGMVDEKSLQKCEFSEDFH